MGQQELWLLSSKECVCMCYVCVYVYFLNYIFTEINLTRHLLSFSFKILISNELLLHHWKIPLYNCGFIRISLPFVHTPEAEGALNSTLEDVWWDQQERQCC